MLFDVRPVPNGVDVALDTGYGADDDSGDTADVDDIKLPILVGDELGIDKGAGDPGGPVDKLELPVAVFNVLGVVVPFDKG